MSRAASPATGRPYGLARVARVWRLSRATVYRHRAMDGAAAPSRPARRGPVGACSDGPLRAVRDQVRAAKTTPASVRTSAAICRVPSGSPRRAADPNTPMTGTISMAVAAVEAGSRRSARNQAR
jgi:hypothetical protein